MSYLVKQLRQNAESGDSCREISEDMAEAAEEIERLAEAMEAINSTYLKTKEESDGFWSYTAAFLWMKHISSKVVEGKDWRDDENEIVDPAIAHAAPDPTTIPQTPPPGYDGDPAHDAGPIALQGPPGQLFRLKPPC